MENLLVRFIPTDYSPKMGWSGNKPALCFAEKETVHCVIIDELEVKVVDRPRKIIDKSCVVKNPQGAGTPYPPSRFAERALGSGRTVTEEAKKLLKIALNGQELKIAPPKPRPVSALKPKPSSQGKVQATAGSELIVTLARELSVPPPKLRRFLRSKGLRAPYTDEKALRKVIQSYGKEKTSGKEKDPASKSEPKKKSKKKGRAG